MELKKQVEELQENQVPSTPPEVLEERRRAASEAARKISEGETLCAKVVEVVSMIWEAILEDATVEMIRASMRKSDKKISVAKAKMKKFSFQEKVTKMAEIKQLQQEF